MKSMKCPIDNTQLAITERKGIEIDYCPECRGIWLDRGELDKMIDKSDSFAQPQPQISHQEHEPYQKQQPYYKQPFEHKKKKRESFLGDLFDF